MPASIRSESTIYETRDLLSVQCPDCGALPELSCKSLITSVRLKSVHQSRVDAAIASGIKSRSEKWSQVIDNVARASRQRDDEALTDARCRLSEQIEAIPNLGSSELVDRLIEFSRRSYPDPRMNLVSAEYGDALKTETLRRLGLDLVVEARS